MNGGSVECNKMCADKMPTLPLTNFAVEQIEKCRKRKMTRKFGQTNECASDEQTCKRTKQLKSINFHFGKATNKQKKMKNGEPRLIFNEKLNSLLARTERDKNCFSSESWRQTEVTQASGIEISTRFPTENRIENFLSLFSFSSLNFFFYGIFHVLRFTSQGQIQWDIVRHTGIFKWTIRQNCFFPFAVLFRFIFIGNLCAKRMSASHEQATKVFWPHVYATIKVGFYWVKLIKRA